MAPDRRLPGLTPEQLEATTEGAMGGVLRTLKRIVVTEGHRLRPLLTGTRPEWERNPDETPDLDTLALRAQQNERFWTDYLASPIDAERPVEVGFQGHTYDVKTGVILAQVVHHGNSHREQVCAILTALGLDPPDLSSWSYGDADGHHVERSQAVRPEATAGEAPAPTPGTERAGLS